MKIKDWLAGTVDDEGQEVQKSFMKQYMLIGPTLVSQSTKKMITGTGLYKAQCEPLLEKTFNELVQEGLVLMQDQLEMTDKSFDGMKTIQLTITADSENDSQMQ